MGRGACLLFPQGAIYNEHLIHIGEETHRRPRHLPSRPAWRRARRCRPTRWCRIGSRCLIGRGSHIVGHWEIVIGDDIQTGPYVYITDQNHTYDDPVEPIGRQWPTEAAVRIGSGSWLGANAVILPGAQIGEHVVVAAGAVVRGDVPDRCVVAGVPARIVRRWVEGTGWVDEKDRHCLLVSGAPNVSPVTRLTLVTVSGQDGPGIAAAALRRAGAERASRSRTSSRSGSTAACCSASRSGAGARRVEGACTRRWRDQLAAMPASEVVDRPPGRGRGGRGDRAAPGHRAGARDRRRDARGRDRVASRACGGNIERIVRLAAYPVHSYELAVAGADLDQLRRALADEAARARGRHRGAGGRAAPPGQAPHRAGRRLDPAAGRGDRPAGRAAAAAAPRWRR